jgi:hypothetical protein
VEQELQSRGVITQTLEWEDKMVLKRVKQQFGVRTYLSGRCTSP